MEGIQMKRKYSIYHVLVALLTFSLFMPAGMVSAEPTPSDTGSLTIHKLEQEPGANKDKPDGSELDNAPQGDPLEGVEFTLTQTHSYDKDTDKWSEVSGEAATYETDENGIIHIPNIDLGRYTVQETDGPDHVVLNEEEYSVDIPMTDPDGAFQNYDVHIYPKNETIRGDVELKKKAGDSKKSLKGVTFTLYKADGTVLQEGLTTGRDGKVSVDNLPFGDYYFQEDATVDGYLLNKEKVKFSVTKPGKTIKVSLKNYKKPEIEKDIDETAVNRGETVTYTLTIELPGDIQNYESFVITDVLHENLEYVDDSQSNPDGFAFNRDGQTLTWTGDPSQLSSGTIDITFDAKVSEDAKANVGIDNVATIDYDNRYQSGGDTTPPVTVVPTAGKLKVMKKDGDSSKTLQGAEFDLLQDGEVIASGTTNHQGFIHFGELDFGEYQLVETKAPEGYNKLRNPIDVTVNEDTLTQTIKVDNFKSGWSLPKTGGIGTLLFTLVGLTFMGAALYLYIRRKRGEMA